MILPNSKKVTNTVSLIKESVRLETFSDKWVFGNDKICNAANLARAGFFFTGTKEEPDAVTCFLCDKTLEGWEEHDNPWTEHNNHNNNCHFIHVGKPEDELTVGEYLEMYRILRLNSIKKARLQLKEEKAAIVKNFTTTKKLLA